MITARRQVGPKAAAVALLGCLVVLTACEKTAVKTSVSPCFRVLPQAHAAVASEGAFVDVARRKGTTIYLSAGGQAPVTSRARPTVTGPAPGSVQGPTSTTLGPNDPRRDACIVAYRGSFDPARIPLLRGPGRTGRYAIVVVAVKSQQVRSVTLTDRLPSFLHHH